MSTAYNREKSDVISSACSAVLSRVKDKTDAYDEAVRKAQRAGTEAPSRDLPRCDSSSWVRWASGILDEAELGLWTRDRDLVDAFEDLANPTLDRLRELPEFRTWEGEELEIRWSRKAIVVRDLLLEEPVAGRVKAVSVADRATWLGGGQAPGFRLELSLPWFLLADEDEVERGLHAVIAACGWDGKPVIRKPDIVAYASTLSRYGVGGIRQACAVAHAQAHPSHARILRDFGFDPESGQGLLWRGHQLERQTNLVDAVDGLSKEQRTRRKPKLAAVEDLPDSPDA